MGGFFGTISKQDCVNDLFYGTDYNSHLGTKRAGLVTFDKESGFHRSIHSLERNYFRSRFEDELDQFKGHQGLGVISDTDPQPIIVNSHLGRYAVVTVAKINNLHEIAEELLKQRMHLSEMSANNINQTELVALLINMGDTFVEGINKVYQKIEGSCSMLILTEDGIIAARDFLGRTPIVIGQKQIHRLSPIGTDEFLQAYAVSSETTSFPNLDYKVVRDLGPGEIVRLRADGIEVMQKPFTRCQICSFLWVYYGFPASDYEGINTEYVREKNGRLMGEKDTEIEPDLVCGIPDSGVGMALGYSHGKQVPYKRAVLKYTPTWPRSFTPGNQNRRDLVAKMKLIPVHELIEGKRLLFVDDSIVRGTQMRETVEFLYENGAKEVHMRSACPPIMYGCKYLNFSRSHSELELIARQIIDEFEGAEGVKYLAEYSDTNTERGKRMRDEICRRLKLTSLEFQSLPGKVKAVGLPQCQLCTYCWDGNE